MRIKRTTVHISDDTGRIAMLETRTFGLPVDDDETDATLTRYIYSNHLQSASLELDKDAEVISYEEYHPYGTAAYQAKNSEIKAVAKRYRYTGKERDEESGLYYHGARYYVPWLCRWCAVDPLESKYAGRTPYCYGANSPVIFNDPDGRQEKKEDGSKNQTKDQKTKPYEGHENYGEHRGVWYVNSKTGKYEFALGVEESSSPEDARTNFLKSKFASQGDFVGVTTSHTNLETGTSVWFAPDGSKIFSYKDGSKKFENPVDRQDGIPVVDSKPGPSMNQSNPSVSNPVSTGYVKIKLKNEDKQKSQSEPLTLSKASDYSNQLLNTAGIIWGSSEIGIKVIRQNNGPQVIGRFLGFGTQRTAAALRSTLKLTSSIGKNLGLFGYGLNVVTLGAKVISGEGITSNEAIGFGVSTALLTLGSVAAGTTLAPFVAAAGIIYGIAGLASWLYNGKSFEDNFFGK